MRDAVLPFSILLELTSDGANATGAYQRRVVPGVRLDNETPEGDCAGYYLSIYYLGRSLPFEHALHDSRRALRTRAAWGTSRPPSSAARASRGVLVSLPRPSRPPSHSGTDYRRPVTVPRFPFSAAPRTLAPGNATAPPAALGSTTLQQFQESMPPGAAWYFAINTAVELGLAVEACSSELVPQLLLFSPAGVASWWVELREWVQGVGCKHNWMVQHKRVPQHAPPILPTTSNARMSSCSLLHAIHVSRCSGTWRHCPAIAPAHHAAWQRMLRHACAGPPASAAPPAPPTTASRTRAGAAAAAGTTCASLAPTGWGPTSSRSLHGTRRGATSH